MRYSSERRVEWYLIKDLRKISQNVLVRCCGVVTRVQQLPSLLSINVDDSTCWMEATLYSSSQLYSSIVPSMGDSIVVFGTPSQKIVAKKKIFKLKIHGMKVIQPEQQFEIMSTIVEATCKRLQVSQRITFIKSNRLKEFSDLESLEIRTYILIILYCTFQSNPDLTNYKFNEVSIAMHPYFKKYKQQKKLQDAQLHPQIKANIIFLFKCNKYFVDNALQTRLKEDTDGKEDFYLISSMLFKKIEQLVVTYIFNGDIKNISAYSIAKRIHAEYNFYEPKEYLFNGKLAEHIVNILHEKNIINKSQIRCLLNSSLK